MTKSTVDLSPFNDIDPINVLVLTPNSRLQRHFSEAYGASCVKEGNSTWRSPEVMSIGSWINEMWLELQDQAYPPAAHKILADANQIHALWSDVISNDTNQVEVLNTQSLASPAIQAYRTLELWQDNDYVNFTPDSMETESYLNWHKTITAEFETRHWVTKESCLTIIIKAIKENDLPLPDRVVLFSFDEIPPLYQSLFDVIANNVSKLIITDNQSKPVSVAKLPVREKDDQYFNAAKWAKAILEKNADATIAIVCPELTKHRAALEEAFMRVFEPQAVLHNVPRYTLPFNFSAGTPLSTVPLIRDALSYISLGTHQTSYLTMSSLLRTPYIAGAEKEQFTRAKFDLTLREGHSNSLNLDNVIQMANCPSTLAEAIGRFLIHTSNTPQELSPSQWAAHFGKSLELLGWPGDRNLDSEEYQALTHWHAQLDQLSQLDAVYNLTTRSHAMNLLNQCVSRTVYQPESENTPIQILGILEASGLHFDHMWVTDLNDDIWPPAPQPNPFIPLITQRNQNMPHASSERELEFSQRMLDRLYSGANNLVMSHAEWNDDKELRCSALIQDMPSIELAELPIGNLDDYTKILYKSIPLLTVDDKSVPVKNLDKVRGGVGILSAQSACPFQAFAKHRLKSGEMPKITIGLNHIERGQLVHHVLEFIWKKLKCQESLLSLEEYEEALIINEAIDFSFFWLKGQRSNLGERLLKIERLRLQTVINQWLALERERAPFVVEECESSTMINIAGLPINIKRDRVDRVEVTTSNEEGLSTTISGRFPIDYKTGLSDTKDWAGERPKAPQIPTYVLSEEEECVGAAFGLVRKGESELKGIAEQTGIATGITSANELKIDLPQSWKDIKVHWLKQLEFLAKEFKSGIATVTPNSLKDCEYCHLSDLCRI